MATIFDSGIITSGRDVNMFDAVDRGLKMGDDARARQNQVNFEAALKQYGAAAYAGDREAQDILSQFDPAAMRDLRVADETAAQNARIAEQELQIKMREAYNNEMSKLSEAEQKAARAEAERIAKGALAIEDEATWNAYVISNGGTPEEYPFALKDQMIYTVLPPDVVQDYVKTKKENEAAKVDVYGQPIPGTQTVAPVTTSPITTAPSPMSGNMFAQPKLSFGSAIIPQGGTTPTPAPTTSGATAAPANGKITVPGVIVPKNRVGADAPSNFGYALVEGQELLVPLPGSEKDNSASLQTEIVRADGLLTLMDNILTASDEDLNAITGSLIEGGPESYLSGVGNLVDAFRGSKTRSLISDIETLKGTGQLIGQQIAKEVSGTGAGSDTESAAIRASIANLSRTNDPAKLKAEVARLKELMLALRNKGSDQLATRSKVYGTDLTVPAYSYTSSAPKAILEAPAAVKPLNAVDKASRLEELRRKAQGN